MKYTRPILLAASALALFISACAQPQDLKTTELETQFGTSNYELGKDVSLGPAGSAYVLSDEFSHASDDDRYNHVVLQRYASSGTKLWSKVVYASPRIEQSVVARVVQSDARGNAYALAGLVYDPDDSYSSVAYSVFVYDANGTFQREFYVGSTSKTFGSSKVLTPPDMAVDAGGNTYVVIEKATRQDELDNYPPILTYSNVLRKYSPSGSLLWERTSGVGTPTGVAIASDGIIYLSGVGGLARYTSAGTVVWKKSGFYNDVATSGSSVYTRNKNNVFAFNSSGQPLWSRFIGGLGNVIIQDLSGDTNGNLYVSGKYPVSGNNWNAFVRKFSASGRSQWSKTYGTPAYDDATGISTLSGSDIYVTGVTLGSLAHPNRGAEDGYVRKLSSVGNPLWTR